jgi:hypothetical protein
MPASCHVMGGCQRIGAYPTSHCLGCCQAPNNILAPACMC